ncbi:hypothetical protein K439DRAFT_1241172, partial [Ramaria rubella]
YEIAVQYVIIGSRTMCNFSLYYLVKLKKSPVFFVELKMYESLRLDSTRVEVNQKMLGRFKEFKQTLEIPTLYRISAFGPQFGVYHMDRDSGEVFPKFASKSEFVMTNNCPISHWD